MGEGNSQEGFLHAVGGEEGEEKEAAADVDTDEGAEEEKDGASGAFGSNRATHTELRALGGFLKSACLLFIDTPHRPLGFWKTPKRWRRASPGTLRPTSSWHL